MRLDDGFAETADQILDGTLPLVYDPLTNSLLTHLARVCPPLPIDFTDDTINAKRFSSAIQVTPERISSSPSGIHYGIYKTVINESYLLSVFSKLASVPFRHGFVLDRWKSATQVMIKKKPEPYLDKLRIIELVVLILHIIFYLFLHILIPCQTNLDIREFFTFY